MKSSKGANAEFDVKANTSNTGVFPQFQLQGRLQPWTSLHPSRFAARIPAQRRTSTRASEGAMLRPTINERWRYSAPRPRVSSLMQTTIRARDIWAFGRRSNRLRESASEAVRNVESSSSAVPVIRRVRQLLPKPFHPWSAVSSL